MSRPSVNVSSVPKYLIVLESVLTTHDESGESLEENQTGYRGAYERYTTLNKL